MDIISSKFEKTADVHKHNMRIYYIIIGALSLIVIGIIIGTLQLVGSPFDVKKINNDKKKFDDLREIKYQMNKYYSENNALPNTLAELNFDEYSYYSDRITKERIAEIDYKYGAISDYVYKICVELETDYETFTKNHSYLEPEIERQKFTRGINCFDYEIESYYRKPKNANTDKIHVTNNSYVEGTFSNFSANLTEDNASFNFDYSGKSKFIVDVSIFDDFSDRIYFTYAQGSSPPLVKRDVEIYTEYACDQTIYWRVIDSFNNQSDIQEAVVTCDTAPTSVPIPSTVPIIN